MGWWNQSADGTSLQPKPTGLVWGDGPADAIDTLLDTPRMLLSAAEQTARWKAALDEVCGLFQAEWHRNPTKEELIAGVMFSLGDFRQYLYHLEPGTAGPVQSSQDY
jgi:hypothetical protein